MSEMQKVNLWPPFKRLGTTVTQRTANDNVDLLGGQLHLNDDISINLGNTLAAPDARLLFETADANANVILLALPNGDATNVPVLILGDQTALNLDLGFFNGVTSPTLALLSDDATKFGRLYHDGTNFIFQTSSGNLGFVGASTFVLAATEGITIDAGTTDHTGTNVLSMDLDVNSASVNGFSFDIDVATALSAGETVNGLSIDIDGLAGDNATSVMNGIYLTSANNTSGVNTALRIAGTWDYGIANTAGSASNPAYTFAGDLDTGIYNSVADTLNFSTAGTARVGLSATAMTFTIPLWSSDGVATSLTLQNQTFTSGVAHNAVSISPTWTTENFNHNALSITATQNGANTQVMAGLQVQCVKTTAVTTLDSLRAIDVLSATITGTVTNNVGIYLRSQTGGGSNWGIYSDNNNLTWSFGASNQWFLAAGAHTLPNVINLDFDVNSASVNGIGIDGEVSTALSAGEIVNGIAIDIDGLAGDNATSVMNGIALTSTNSTGGINTAIRIAGTWDSGILNQYGLTETPAYSYTSDPDTGFFHHATTSGLVHYSSDGTTIVSLGSTYHLYSNYIHARLTNAPMTVIGNANDGATAVGVVLNNIIALTVAGGKLVSVQNAGVEKAAVGLNGEIMAGAGTALLPSLSLLGDPDTGFYNYSANVLGFAAGGVVYGALSSSGCDFNTFSAFQNVAVTLRARVQLASEPTTCVILDNTVTMVNAATKLLSIRNNTSEKDYFDVLGDLFLPAGTVTVPAIGTTGDTNTGIFWPAGDQFAITCGGVQQFTVKTSGIVNFAKWRQTASGQMPYIEGADTSDGAGRACKIGNEIALTTVGDRLLELYSDSFSTLRAYIDYLGGWTTTQGIATTGSPALMTLTGGAHTTLTNANLNDVYLNLNRTVQFIGAAGPTTITNAFGLNITAPSYQTAGAGALTITNGATAYIAGAPVGVAGGGGVLFTNGPFALLVDDGAVRLDGFTAINMGQNPNMFSPLSVGWNNSTMMAGTTAARHLYMAGNITELINATITDIVGAYFNTFTITDGGGTETVGTVATVYINDAPTVGTAPTNGPYALFVDAGISRFDGLLDLSAISAGSPNVKITATTDVPTATWGAAAGNEVSTTPAGWLEIEVGGNPRYIPFWA